jgi:lipopolysaccharide transport system permease protein
MNAAYLDPRAKLDQATGLVRLSFEVRNESPETWRGDAGFALGYHLFDADTGTLIVDGARVPTPDVQPGQSARVAMDIAVPPEDGRYQLWISPMREDVCWYYERGWPFLLIEAEVAGGQARIAAPESTTRAALHRRQSARSIGRALYYPILTIWRNRALIRTMVRREVMGRYRGSFGGSFWTFMSPLLLMLTYFFVFSIFLKSQFPQDPTYYGYVLYFLAGMLPWLAFSEAVGRAPNVVLDHRNFVKKLVFAVETLPFNLVAGGLVSEFFAVIVFSGVVLAVRHSLPSTILWLPLLVIPQVLFTAGVAWFLAALGAFVRDLGQLIGFVLTIWFFMSPICYPEDSWPKWGAPFLDKNPICILVRGYRAIFLEHRPPAFSSLWKFWLLAAVVFVLGHAWFYKLRKSFADMI